MLLSLLTLNRFHTFSGVFLVVDFDQVNANWGVHLKAKNSSIEVVVLRYSVKKGVLKIPQNSQENTLARVFSCHFC